MKLFIILSLTAFAIEVQSLPESRIVGGIEAQPGAWPWQLGLFIEGKFTCGASILGPTWGVTAAHCVGYSASDYTIKAGTNILHQKCDKGDCVERVLNKRVIHPEYSTNGYPNDIAFISWKEPIHQISEEMYVKYVPMAEDRDQVGKKCYISGWGSLSGNGYLPNELRQAKVEVITQSTCRYYWYFIIPSQICVFDPDYKERGACNGDSGGPLVCEYEKDEWKLAGVASFVLKGCDTSAPPVYTRVSSYTQWLLENAAGV